MQHKYKNNSQKAQNNNTQKQKIHTKKVTKIIQKYEKQKIKNAEILIIPKILNTQNNNNTKIPVNAIITPSKYQKIPNRYNNNTENTLNKNTRVIRNNTKNNAP